MKTLLTTLALVSALAGCGAGRPDSPQVTPPAPAATPTARLSQAQADQQLLRAAADGDADAARVALDAGADTETRDGHQRTPLLLAAMHDHVGVAKLLVGHGADPDALDDRHDTPWLVTGVTGSVAMLEALLPARPDLTIENRYGGVSLVPACEAGHVAYVKRVLRTGEDVNHVTNQGLTCLLEAVMLGDGGPEHQQIVAYILAHGADRTIRDPHGLNALQYAEKYGYDEIAALLRKN
jgi:ankyrin repeat protein